MRRLRQLGRAAVGYVVKVSAAMLLALAAYEGFVSPPYQDVAGVWTNGYGNTVNVGPHTPPVTKEQALAQLSKHVDSFTADVLAAIDHLPITQGMLDAFVSLTYNIGGGAFKKSTAASDFRQGDYMAACLRILRFDQARVKGKLQPVKGLAARRYGEYNTCLAGVPPESLRYVQRR